MAVQHCKDSDLVPSKHTIWRQTKHTGYVLHTVFHTDTFNNSEHCTITCNLFTNNCRDSTHEVGDSILGRLLPQVHELQPIDSLTAEFCMYTGTHESKLHVHWHS
jgi:hypothetical protein